MSLQSEQPRLAFSREDELLLFNFIDFNQNMIKYHYGGGMWMPMSDQ